MYNLETNYEGGGIFEGTWHGTYHKDGHFTIDSISYGALGSVEGQRAKMSMTSNIENTVFTWTAMLYKSNAD